MFLSKYYWNKSKKESTHMQGVTEENILLLEVQPK